MTVNMLIQIDKLVQLLESPVFTYLRLQLLEPEKYPHLYKCLYGLLMLLPQSSAFAALKNRLNSVSTIGYLHIAAPRATSTSTGPSNYDRPNRLKGRDEGGIRWVELLEKFKSVQEKSRRTLKPAGERADDGFNMGEIKEAIDSRNMDLTRLQTPTPPLKQPPTPTTTTGGQPGHKPRSSLSNKFGRFGSGISGNRSKK